VNKGAGRRSPRASGGGRGARTVRLGELLREVVAEELRRIDDPRLELVSITNVEVDADLNRAIVSYDSLAGESGDPEILEALGAWRVRLQAAVGRQIHARKTPILQFRPDEVIRSAERIDRLLRGTEVGALDEVRSDDGPGGDAIADETPGPSGSTDGGRGADAGSA